MPIASPLQTAIPATFSQIPICAFHFSIGAMKKQQLTRIIRVNSAVARRQLRDTCRKKEKS
jgi:hypothetical protein